MSIKKGYDGEFFMVLIDGEFGGWFNIPQGDATTEILRSALSSNPTIVNFTDLDLDINDLPAQADGWIWDGTTFNKN